MCYTVFIISQFSDIQVVSALDIRDRYAYIQIRTSDIIVEEEYEIYDFNGIVGTVGGSLGLFVGFSFLQCMLFVMSIICAKCQK